MINKNVVDFTALSRTFYYCACNPWNLLWRCQYELNTAAPTIFCCCFFFHFFSSRHQPFNVARIGIFLLSIFNRFFFFFSKCGFQFLHLQMCKRKITHSSNPFQLQNLNIKCILCFPKISTNLKCLRIQLI